MDSRCPTLDCRQARNKPTVEGRPPSGVFRPSAVLDAGNVRRRPPSRNAAGVCERLHTARVSRFTAHQGCPGYHRTWERGRVARWTRTPYPRCQRSGSRARGPRPCPEGGWPAGKPRWGDSRCHLEGLRDGHAGGCGLRAGPMAAVSTSRGSVRSRWGARPPPMFFGSRDRAGGRGLLPTSQSTSRRRRSGSIRVICPPSYESSPSRA